MTAASFTGLVLLAFFGSDAANESNVPHLQALLSATCDFGFRPASAACWDYWGEDQLISKAEDPFDPTLARIVFDRSTVRLHVLRTRVRTGRARL